MFPRNRNQEAGVYLRVAETMEGKYTHMIPGPIPLNQRVAAGLVSAGGEATFYHGQRNET